MKNLIRGLAVLIVLTFVMVGSAQAIPVPAPAFVGDTAILVDSGLGTTPPPLHQDTLENVNLLILIYNDVPDTEYDPLPFVTAGIKIEIGDEEGEIPLPVIIDVSGYEYISLKQALNFDLWWVKGLGEMALGDDFGLTDLSHYTLWNPTSVPEPATMLLFGAGLLGLAVLRRKFIK